jgi:hypothetical protein
LTPKAARDEALILCSQAPSDDDGPTVLTHKVTELKRGSAHGLTLVTARRSRLHRQVATVRVAGIATSQSLAGRPR